MARYDTLIAKLVTIIPRNLTPNHLAVIRLVCAIPIAFAILNAWYLTALGIFILASALDVIDGTLARTRGQVSTAGEMLDPIADKILFGVTFALLGFSLLPANLYLSVLMVEFVTILGAAVTSSVWYWVHREEPRVGANRFGKYKTVCYFIATLLLFIAPWSIPVYLTSVIIYYVGLLNAVLSMVQYNLRLSRKA
jgi:CDP-diacylglycerol--glycerol-3-phosphate 3-phosphatidyltransferase